MRGRHSRERLNANRRFTRAAVLVCAAAGLLLLAGAPQVGATTGPTPLTKPPLWTLSKRQARPFIGRFKMVAPHGGQLISADYAAMPNEFGYMEGTLVVYTYDEEGQETSWVGRTYEYHSKGRGKMTIDVIAAANENIFAKLRLQVTRRGELTGILEPIRPPLAPVRPQRITLRRVN